MPLPWMPPPKGKGGPIVNPFAAITPTPFSHSGYHAAFGTPPPWTPSESSTVPAVSNVPPEHKELLAAVKSAFPDMAKMPTAIREAVEKTSALSSKQLVADLHKAAASLGKARKAVKELQDAKLKHRSMWASHLQEALTAWQSQIQAFNAQQADYTQKLCKAQADLQSANDWIQELNIQAKAMDVKPLEESGDVTDLQEPSELQPEHIQEQLKLKLEECVKLTGFSNRAIDLTEDDQEKAEKLEQDRKRARSVEPEAAEAPGVPSADSAMASAS